MTAGKTTVYIENVGTADLNNAVIHVMCQALGVKRASPNNPMPAASDEWLNVTLSAGAATNFKPSMIINVSLYSYQFITCTILLEGDPTPNMFTIAIP
jgi:hypothetical protein